MSIEDHKKSMVWALGFLTFVIPSAVPSLSQYRANISFYILMGFTSVISIYYFALYYWRRWTNKTLDEKSPLLEEALISTYPTLLVDVEEGNAGK